MKIILTIEREIHPDDLLFWVEIVKKGMPWIDSIELRKNKIQEYNSMDIVGNHPSYARTTAKLIDK